MGIENRREKFLQIYANLPLGIRDEIIAIVDGKPITWNVAYIEIINKTKLSEKILEAIEGIIEDKEVDWDELKRLVKIRLETIPSNIKLSIGNYGVFDKETLLKEVENESEVGKFFVHAQLQYLRSLKEMFK